ncbi:RNA polymerase sigma factor SigJ [Ktedonospora formicarum]|uniref:DNA-directed RNA polymerase sigma-70 factor n=1 Tax=Ktedonospora formicarum TaxID=2778364 RepID=A0A8J3ID75_9CHLR|nr:RNA polymerase sigma factor SigJ [Ktedonospora formicarum]GHO51045.1 DNA-directed RNA polymerase sigma-70 factor [Ktedonospora formicarum]
MDQFEALRSYLFSIAYRMVASASIAEDLVQDTYIRYLQAKPEHIQSLKAYLTTIIVRLSLNYLQSAQHEREQYYGIWLPEPMMSATQDIADRVEADETLSLAFLNLLEKLSPPERAVFVLHEILDFPFADIADIVEKKASTCRQLFHRAKEHLSEKKRRFTTDSEQANQLLVHQFVNAIRSGNLETLTSILAKDAVSWADGGGKVQAARYPLTGNARIAKMYITIFQKYLTPTMSVRTGVINHMPALLIFEHDVLLGVWILGLNAQTVEEIFVVVNPDKLAYLSKQLSQGAELGELI